MTKKIFSILLFSILPLSASAQVGTVTDALGGAGIGAAQPLDSALMNTASLAQLKDYYFGMQYFRGNYTGDDNLDQFGLTVTDSGEEAVIPGAFTYRRRNHMISGVAISENLFQLGGALPITPQWSLGLSAYLLRTNLSSGTDYNQTNSDASLFWKASEKLSLGFVARSLFGSKNVAYKTTQYRPQAGFGVAYNVMELLILRGDLSYNYENNPDKRFVHNIGSEFLMQEDFILRAGYKNDDYKRETYYSVGLGWEGPRLKIAYAYQHEIRHDLGDAHTIDIWLDL